MPILKTLCCSQTSCFVDNVDMEGFRGLKRTTSQKSMGPYGQGQQLSEVFDRESPAARKLYRQESVVANQLVRTKLEMTHYTIKDICRYYYQVAERTLPHCLLSTIKSMKMADEDDCYASSQCCVLKRYCHEFSHGGKHVSVFFRGLWILVENVHEVAFFRLSQKSFSQV